MESKFGEPEQKKEKLLTPIEESTESSATARKKIKGMFLEKDKMQMSSYIKDLEKTLALNKEIIAELVRSEKPEVRLKQSVEKLNKESGNLQLLLKRAIKERDDCQARLLIVEQINEELRNKEDCLDRQYSAKVQEYLDQLNRKEFVLQTYEKRYHKVELVLQRIASRDPEAQQVLREVNGHEPSPVCISSVVKENAVLATAIRTERDKVAVLENFITELAQADPNNARAVHALKASMPDVGRLLATKQSQGMVQAGPRGQKAWAQQLEAQNLRLQTQITEQLEEIKQFTAQAQAEASEKERLYAEIHSLKDANRKLGDIISSLKGRLRQAEAERTALKGNSKATSSHSFVQPSYPLPNDLVPVPATTKKLQGQAHKRGDQSAPRIEVAPKPVLLPTGKFGDISGIADAPKDLSFEDEIDFIQNL